MRALVLLACLALAAPVAAQSPPKHEFRGAWIATVVNLDWPSCRECTADQQKAQLIDILDGLKEAGINAALFQIRTEADALYDSPYEPWSYWLTGEQGAPPEPYYDPLAFAIEEAHKRGMELHAWFNPYRADRGSDYPKAANHVTNTHPEWILDFGSIQILDPGLPAVRDYVTSVVTDVVRRYDVDGVHFDDYFYPYPPNQISNEDAATYAEYGAGFNDIGNWRRFNVFRFVRQVRDSIQAVKPEVVYGISPFGIWKNGVPAGIAGLDAYSVVYADAVAWMNDGLLDYLTPQLYWAFGGAQDYGKLAPWWESVRNGRHLYPGHGLYRSERATFSGALFSASEVPDQIRLNRSLPGIDGSVFFRAKNITLYGSKGFADTLATDLYRYPALPPPMAWKSQVAPEAPTGLEGAIPTDIGGGGLQLTWQAPEESVVEARFFAVYRVPEAEADDLAAAMQKAENLAGVTGETVFHDVPPVSGTYTYVVTSVSPNSVESAPSNPITRGITDAEKPGAPLAFALDAWPNPVASSATVSFTLRQPAAVTVRIVDALGREVARLLDGETRPAATHTLTWAPGGLGSGAYFVVLDADGERAARALTVVR